MRCRSSPVLLLATCMFVAATSLALTSRPADAPTASAATPDHVDSNATPAFRVALQPFVALRLPALASLALDTVRARPSTDTGALARRLAGDTAVRYGDGMRYRSSRRGRLSTAPNSRRHPRSTEALGDFPPVTRTDRPRFT